MKKHLLILAGLFVLSLCGFAQSNLVIFSEDGDAFFAYVNGIKQNTNPETNVKVTGLSPSASLRVEFADKNLPQLKQSMYMENGMEYSVRIKRNAKKELKLRMFGQTPIAEAPASGATTVPYHSTDNTASGTAYNTTTDANNQNNGNTSVTSSTTTTNVNNGTPGNASININMSGTGVNMNVSGMDPNGVNTTSSTTVTSSSSSSSSSYSDVNNGGSYNNTTNNNTGHHNSNGNNHHPSSNGCSIAMHQANFDKMKQSVEAKPFSDTKMSTAKVATKNACLSANQIKEICKLFSMDEDKLAYAKYAYDYCVDKADFYRVSEVFSFSTTTDDLNKFLESK